MTSRTRYFVVASLLVLTVGLGTGLVAYYAGFPGLAGAAPVADLQMVPSEAQFIGFVNVRDVMASDLRQRVRQVMPIAGAGQRELFDLTGLNVDTDIDRVLACLVPSAAGQPGPGRPLLLAHGTFDAVRIEGVMRQGGGTAEVYKGTRIVLARDGQTRLALAFVEPGFVALGDEGLVRGAIDRRTASEPASELVERARTGHGDLWAMGRVDALAGQAGLSGLMAAGLPAVSWFSLNATIDSGVHGMLTADTRDPQAAESLRDVVRGLVALARLQAGAYPEVKGFVDALTLAGTGNTVTLGFDVPASMIDFLGSLVGTGPAAPRFPLNPGK